MSESNKCCYRCGYGAEVTNVVCTKPDCPCHSTTPDTEWERDEKLLRLYISRAYPSGLIEKLLDEVLSSRDTYWKEQLQKAREEEAEQIALMVRFYLERDDTKRALDCVDRYIKDHSELDQDKV